MNIWKKACVSQQAQLSQNHCQRNCDNTVCTSAAVAQLQLQNNQGGLTGGACKRQRRPNVKSNALKPRSSAKLCQFSNNTSISSALKGFPQRSGRIFSDNTSRVCKSGKQKKYRLWLLELNFSMWFHTSCTLIISAISGMTSPAGGPTASELVAASSSLANFFGPSCAHPHKFYYK